jgi:hypothetical protein
LYVIDGVGPDLSRSGRLGGHQRAEYQRTHGNGRRESAHRIPLELTFASVKVPAERRKDRYFLI